MNKPKNNKKLYKIYFNFPTANQRPKKRFMIHLTSHEKIHVVGSNRNGVLIDDFSSKSELILALKIMIRKFRDDDREYEIVDCPQCLPKV